MTEQKFKILTIDENQIELKQLLETTEGLSIGNQNAAQPSFSNVSLDEELCNKLSFAPWATTYKPEDIDGGLATDFDGSLQGLGVEVEADAYDMRLAAVTLFLFTKILIYYN